MVSGDIPGDEIPKEYREVVLELVRNQGWRYDKNSKQGGHPRLFPPDQRHRQLAVPTTPGDSAHGFKNWVAQVRRSGGIWPVKRGAAS